MMVDQHRAAAINYGICAMKPQKLKTNYYLGKITSIRSVALLSVVSLLAIYYETSYVPVLQFHYTHVKSSAESRLRTALMNQSWKGYITGRQKAYLSPNQNVSDSVRFGNLRQSVAKTNRSFYQAKGSFAIDLNFTLKAMKTLKFNPSKKYPLPGIESMDKYKDPSLMINYSSIDVIPQRRDFRLIISDNSTCRSLSHTRDAHHANSFDFKNDVFLLIGIKSTCNHGDRRDAIRFTWGNESWIFNTTGVRVKLVFLLGACVTNGDTGILWYELTEHSDILQWDFKEGYHTLSLKHCLLWQWYATHCMEVPFLLEGDDDMLMNLRNILDYLMSLPSKKEQNLYLGSLILGQRPIRVITSRYYVSTLLYPPTYYPSYVSGGGFLISGSAVVRCWIATFWKYILPVGDAFVGTVAKAVGVRPSNGGKSFATWGLKEPTPYNLSKVKTYHQVRPPELIKMWDDMNDYYEAINANYTANYTTTT